MRKVLAESLLLASAFISTPQLAGFAQISNPKTPKDDAQAQIVGTWRGDSVCAVENSPCHNEVNVYRFSAVAEKPGWFSVTGSRVVEGKEIVMGTGEWKYEARKHLLESDTRAGTFRFTVDGNKLEGSLTLPDGTLYRRIFLKKETKFSETLLPR